MGSFCGKKKKYQPDMLGLHRSCSYNYLLILKLLPELTLDEPYFYHLDNACYQLNVCEQTQYTSVLNIEPIATNVLVSGETDNALTPQLKVRLYHDAQMAEVLASRQIRYFKSRYDYPNRLMQQPDEKYQINKFLTQWLNHCFKDGRVMTLDPRQS
jgi:uncharacterized protein YqiB (DUF1249 family)